MILQSACSCHFCHHQAARCSTTHLRIKTIKVGSEDHVTDFPARVAGSRKTGHWPVRPHRTSRPRRLAALYEFVDLIGRCHGTVYQCGTKSSYLSPSTAPVTGSATCSPDGTNRQPARTRPRRRRPSTPPTSTEVKRRAGDYLRAAVERRSGRLLLGRQRARIPGTHLDPRGELVVGVQIVGTDRNHPGMSRLRMFISVAFVVVTREFDCAGSTRTMAPPSPLAAMAMLPRMRKASPPNIFLSVSSGSLPMSWRIRSASSSS
jgi:hypothetical protein